MKRLLPALAVSLAVAGPAGTAEFTPRDYYTAILTGLGAGGGAVLGLALDGMGRNPDSEKSFTAQWTGVGAVFGAVLGREAALSSLEAPSDSVGKRPVSTREANSCLGALAGQLAGYGIAYAVKGPLHPDDKEMWAGIALGTLLGSVVAWALPPIPFLRLPPDRSRREESVLRDATRLETGSAISPGAEDMVRRNEAIPPPLSPPLRPVPESRTARLNMLLLTPEHDRMLGPSPLIEPAPAPGPAEALPADPREIPRPATPVVQLGIIAGGLLGGASGASLGGPKDEIHLRAAIGGGVGALGGWILSASHTRQDDERGEADTWMRGRTASISSACGIAGGILGIATGAVLRNNLPEARYSDRNVAWTAAGGTATGILAGYLFSKLTE